MPERDAVHLAAAGACGAGGLAARLQRGAAALGAWWSHAGLDQAAVVLACVKPAARRLRRWPAARLDPGCARRPLMKTAGTEKRRSTEQRNTVTMGVAATQDSTSEWRELGAQVTSSDYGHAEFYSIELASQRTSSAKFGMLSSAGNSHQENHNLDARCRTRICSGRQPKSLGSLGGPCHIRDDSRFLNGTLDGHPACRCWAEED